VQAIDCSFDRIFSQFAGEPRQNEVPSPARVSGKYAVLLAFLLDFRHFAHFSATT